MNNKFLKIVAGFLPGACLSEILKVFVIALVLQGAIVPLLRAQTQTSYVREWQACAPETNPNTLITRPLSDAKQVTKYVDGMGRPIQVVSKLGSLETSSGNNEDLVTLMEYDLMGRQSKMYLPYVGATGDGSYKTGAAAQQNAFYAASSASNPINGQGETYYYGKVNYESSPMGRPVLTMEAGNNWVGSNRGIQQGYWSNTTTDDVKMWNVTNSGSASVFGTYSVSGAYPAGTLTKQITTDENGNQTIVFKDKEGQLILKKVQLTAPLDDGATGSGYTGWLCTYYIYDILNNLRAIIQPAGVAGLPGAGWVLSSTVLSEQCFLFEYDARKRMIMKKTPGTVEVYFVYDARDRLVMTQDGNLRSPVSKWMVAVYDNFDRPVQTGLLTDATPFATHLLNAYSSTTYPSTASGFELLSQTHYDDYLNLPTGLVPSMIADWNSQFSATSTSVYPYPVMPAQNINTTTKGLTTWTQVKVVGTTSTFLSSAYIYDEKSHIIQYQNQNVTGGLDVTSVQYTWDGHPLVTVFKEQKLGTNAQTTVSVTQKTYDVLGREIQSQQKISNTLINSNAMTGFVTTHILQYDVIGEVRNKQLGFKRDAGGNYTTTPLEMLNYEYNIRRWLLGVNRSFVRDVSSASNVTNSGEVFTTPTPSPTAGNFFGFDLGYDKTNNNLPGGQSYAAAQYNGNITGTVWKSAHDGQIRKYDFTYDATNRLTGGDFNQFTNGTFNKTAGVDFSVSNLTYDANGNILTMNQKGLVNNVSQLVDQLTYTMQTGSNKLAKVSDAAPSNAAAKLGDFQDGTNSGDDYSYDNNGNLTSDANKQMSSIQYNHLNLPNSVTVTSKGTITYIYDAAGNKLQKTTVDNTVTPAKTTVTTYICGFVYENDILEFIPQEEGRVRPVSTTGYVFDYYLKDQTSSTRLVITDDQAATSPILEASSYYPFGLMMAGISNKVTTANYYENKQKFNFGSELSNKEFSDGSGLEWYETSYRILDPQLGRWLQTDPFASKLSNTSPFDYVLNNPIRYVDPLGLDTIWIRGKGKFNLQMKDGDILAWVSQDNRLEVSYYMYCPDCLDAVNGFVEQGTSEQLPAVVVRGRQGQSIWTEGANGTHIDGSFSSSGASLAPWVGIGSSIAAYGLYNKGKWWYSLKQNKFYNFKFNGNGATGGREAFAHTNSVNFERLNYAMGVLTAADIEMQYRSGEINEFQRETEHTSNAIATFGGIYGAAWGIGWETGRIICSNPWYRLNVRPIVQDILGVERDEVPKALDIKPPWMDDK